MFKFLKERKAQQRATKYRRGWDFAAGRILEDGPQVAIAVLSANVETSRSFDSYDSFDEGVEAAIKRWNKFEFTVEEVTQEMRNRLVGHKDHKQSSPTLIAWASRICIAFDRIGNDD